MKNIILPSREEMLQRLKTVNSSDVDLQKCLYPKFLFYAEQELSIPTVVSTIILLAQDCKRICKKDIDPLLPDFVEALVVDENDLKEAKEFLSELVSILNSGA